MSANWQSPEPVTDGQVLRWTGRVVTAADLRRSLNGHRELVIPERAIITPLANEELRSKGVRVVSKNAEPVIAPQNGWGLAQDCAYPEVASAVQSLRREGLTIKELASCTNGDCGAWSKALAECVTRGECRGGIAFCQAPGLVCCVANKVAGLRAITVATIGQTARAVVLLSPNLIAVEMPGRTFFEIRQMLRSLCLCEIGPCPDGVACTLRELDGHAHR